MYIHELSPAEGSKKDVKRVGRGHARATRDRMPVQAAA